jgi:hypothetical protein
MTKKMTKCPREEDTNAKIMLAAKIEPNLYLSGMK